MLFLCDFLLRLFSYDTSFALVAKTQHKSFKRKIVSFCNVDKKGKVFSFRSLFLLALRCSPHCVIELLTFLLSLCYNLKHIIIQFWIYEWLKLIYERQVKEAEVTEPNGEEGIKLLLLLWLRCKRLWVRMVKASHPPSENKLDFSNHWSPSVDVYLVEVEWKHVFLSIHSSKAVV